MKQNISIGIALVALGISAYLLMSGNTQKKIAYIRSTELVYGYFGMQEAHKAFEEKSKTWQANIDTLQRDYQREISKFTTDMSKLSEEDKKIREKILMEQQKSLMSYSQAIQEKAKEEDDKTTQAVLNQINSFVEEYGKEHGYEIILGTTNSGSLLYGDGTMDITKEVLEALNRNYKGENQRNTN